MGELVRGPGGRFAPGTAGGPGKPKGKYTVADYEKAARDVVTPETFAELTLIMVEHVRQTGSIRAYTALADRLIGKPRVMEEDGAVEGMERLIAAMQAMREERLQQQQAIREADSRQWHTIEAERVNVGE